MMDFQMAITPVLEVGERLLLCSVFGWYSDNLPKLVAIA